MSLSKKNLDKLNKFKKNKNLNIHSNNISNFTERPNNDNLISNSLNSEDPNKIFYSLIDNSESLEDTSKVNNSLRKSELNQINMKTRKANFSNRLTTEEELYDEFNYLLDE
jgi:cellulose biosynthesis protein BcsQ